MREKRMLTVVALVLLGVATGLTAYAVARRATSPQGFTLRLKDFAILPDGTRRGRGDMTIYVSASGDVREVRREADSGEVTETLKLTSDGAVYRIGQKRLHYAGRWRQSPRAAFAIPPGAERGVVAGQEVIWRTLNHGKSRVAEAPSLQGMLLYVENAGGADEPVFALEAYAVEFGEPPAELFKKPDLPESREWYSHTQAQRKEQEKE